ncbi:MAG: macrolide family glycosyltransferase, partial [Faecousia sp.]
MSRIVFFCIPAQGHTNPTLGVVRELVARGHEVLYYSYSMLREKIEAAGATFVACDEFDAEQHLTPQEGARIGSDLALSTRVLVDTTLALDQMVCAEMERLRPDCIVADSMAVWGKAVAMKLGIPFVSSTTTFAFNQHSAKIMKQGPKELLSMVFSMRKVGKQIKRLQERGYPVKNILDIISNDDQTDTIVYTSPQFQPCSETFSEKYAFVGPSIRPAQSEIRKTGDKLVYISMGTVNNDMLPLYQNCIAALKDTGYQGILSVGNQVDLSQFGSLPEGIDVYPSVDQIAVLEKADVFLTHCGMNSASEGLYYGVPLVMLPKTTEQGGVAARVEQLGAGLTLKSTTPAAIRQAIGTALTDSKYRESAARIAEGFRSCPGAKGAADKIE